MKNPYIINLLVVNSFFVIHLFVVVMADSESNGQVYQPTKQEIERFQVIQEQIRHHQQEEQREQERKIKQQHDDMEIKRQESSQIQLRHPAESLLIPHSALVPTFIHKQQIHSDHRVPMPPMLPVPPPPPPPQLSPFSFGTSPMQFQVAQFHPQQTPTAMVLPDINNHNPFQTIDKIRQPQMNNHQPFPAQQPHSRNLGHHNLEFPNNKYSRKHYEDRDDHQPEDNLNKMDKHHLETGESPSRFDKNRMPQHGPDDTAVSNHNSQYGGRYRCYSCHWNIAKCSDFNCYNNPDICTNNNFAPHMVQQADCIGGCEEFVITDPNGLTQQWKRGCAQPGGVPAIRMRCQTYYEFGVRIDRCVCNTDWCNGTNVIGQSSKLIIILIWITSSIISFIIIL